MLDLSRNVYTNEDHIQESNIFNDSFHNVYKILASIHLFAQFTCVLSNSIRHFNVATSVAQNLNTLVSNSLDLRFNFRHIFIKNWTFLNEIEWPGSYYFDSTLFRTSIGFNFNFKQLQWIEISSNFPYDILINRLILLTGV